KREKMGQAGKGLVFAIKFPFVRLHLSGTLRQGAGHCAVELPVSTRHVPVNCRSRSEEHTSELQSRENLVCRLLLEKKNILLTRFTSPMHDPILLEGEPTGWTQNRSSPS